MSLPRPVLGVTLLLAVCGGCQSETTIEGKPLSRWIETLESRDVAKRDAAVAALVKLGPAVRPALSEAIGHPDTNIRIGATQALLLLDPAAKDEVLRALHRGELKYRVTAAAGLVRANMELPSAVATLRLGLQDREAHLVSVGAFSDLGPQSVAAIPILLEMLNSPRDVERDAAVCGLLRIGPAAREAVPALVAAISSEDAALRERAAQILGAIGPASSDAVAALETAARDANSNVRFRAAQALRQIRRE